MDRSKLVLLGLLVVWGALTAVRITAQQSLLQAQACCVDASRRSGMEKLCMELKARGVIVAQKAGQTEIVYRGRTQDWTSLVNRLLEFPLPWASWQTRVDSAD